MASQDCARRLRRLADDYDGMADRVISRVQLDGGRQ
jgi:hypothetical protein